MQRAPEAEEPSGEDFLQSQKIQVQENHLRRPEIKLDGVSNQCSRNAARPQIVLPRLDKMRANSMDSSVTYKGLAEYNCSSNRL